MASSSEQSKSLPHHLAHTALEVPIIKLSQSFEYNLPHVYDLSVQHTRGGVDTTFQLAEDADINRVSADQANLFKIAPVWTILSTAGLVSLNLKSTSPHFRSLSRITDRRERVQV
ncbi:MAG: hypothetical protein H0W49_10985 [Nitrospirales bacterium]|nr:hypothetical protein [Nitrospirales bacterium]